MFPSSLRIVRSKPILTLTVGLGLYLISVPAAMAVTTAVATASLSFNLSSPNGQVGFSSLDLNGTAELSAAPPAIFHGFWNIGSNTSFIGSDSIAGNSFSLSSSVTGRSFSSTSSVSLSLPPYQSSDGKASSFNFANIDTINIVPVDGLFDLKFSGVNARLDLNLGTDANGISAFGDASWFIGLRYSLLDEVDGGSNTFSLTRSIGTDNSYSDTDNYNTSFTFSSIPAAATNIQLYWETTAEAHAVDTGHETILPVPDGGSTIALFGTGLGALGWMRHKTRRRQS